MVHIAGEVVVARPPEVVFDLVADERNEPAYNPGIRDVVKVTPGPIDTGTRFEARARGWGAVGVMTIEWKDYDRPRRLGSSVRSRAMQVDGVLTFVPVPGGTRFAWSWDLRLPGPYAVLTPLVALLGPRSERRTWLRMKAYAEAADTSAS